MSKWYVVRTQTIKYVLVEVADDDENPETTALNDAQSDVMADEAEFAHDGPLEGEELERWQRHCDVELPLEG
jgi:hypothetical protein